MYVLGFLFEKLECNIQKIKLRKPTSITRSFVTKGN